MPIRKGELSRKLNQLDNKKKFHNVISGKFSPAALHFFPHYDLIQLKLAGNRALARVSLSIMRVLL